MMNTVRRAAEAIVGIFAAAVVGALFLSALFAILTFATGFLTFARHL
ncbi:hypothetical protein [Novosphingobium sp. 17-62-19]|nr:hypothetical protein [Novosphingobium sp. 17-62-19]HQS95057.1 hypothetical protein [Novosphingobium sp.]